MFGLFKKKIPAPDHERAILVRRMFLGRCEQSPDAQVMEMVFGDSPKDIPAEMLLQGAPEATVLRVVEQFYQLKDRGTTDEFALKTLNQMHASLLSMAGEKLSELQSATSLFQYVRHIVDALHGHGEISDHSLIDTIQEIKEFYKR